MTPPTGVLRARRVLRFPHSQLVVTSTLFTPMLETCCRASQVSSTHGTLVVNGKKIVVYAVMNAAEIPWGCALRLAS